MVDEILTKIRNPVNQELWLMDRFGTSVNHLLFLSLGYDSEHDTNQGMVQYSWRRSGVTFTLWLGLFPISLVFTKTFRLPPRPPTFFKRDQYENYLDLN